MSRPRLRLRPRGDGTVLSAGLVLTLLAAGVAAIAAEPVVPPVDEDPNAAGIQVSVPYFSEPEFLLSAGDQRWNVRNRPAGTVAAGYGHTDDALSDALTASARYQPLGAPDFGATEPTGRRLDVSYLAPIPSLLPAPAPDGSTPGSSRGTPATRSRSTDRSRRGSTTALSSVRSRVPPTTGYVGGAVAADDEGVVVVVLVSREGQLVQYTMGPNLRQPKFSGASENLWPRLRGATPMSATAHGTGPSATCTRRSRPLI